jgi:hypothetical protein
MTTFKDKYKDIQYLIRDMQLLRKYNDLQATNKTLNNCLLFAEATTTILAFERFLRILPAMNARHTETLSNFMDRALAKKKPLFKTPILNIPNKRIISVVREIRNGVMHGNFDQLAIHYAHKIRNREEYFSMGCFTQDIQIIYDVFNSFINQVDARTGKII